MRRTTLLAVISLALAALPGQDGPTTRPLANGGAALPPRLDFALAEADWQPLPRGVHDVRVSPDGRMWLMVARQDRQMDAAAVRERWAAEFHKAMPQVEWGEVVLFEPRRDDPHALARVWFSRGFENMSGTPLLWGFDGREWVEREAPPLDGVQGQGRWHHQHAVYAGGRAWFFSGGQVASFDGQQWETHEMLKFDRKADGAPQIVSCAGLEDDLFAYFGLGERRRLARWKDGKWTDLPFPNIRGRISSMVPTDDALLVLVESRVLPIYLGEQKAPPTEVLRDIDLLADADFRTREAATLRLIDAGWPYLAHLRQAESEVQTPERRNRLRLIIATLEGRVGARIGRPTSYIAGYLLETCTRLHRSEDGTVRLLALAVAERGVDHGPAELILSPGEAPRVAPVLRDEISGYNARGWIVEWMGADGKLVQWEQRLKEEVRHLPETAAPRSRSLVRTSGGPAAVPLTSFDRPVAALPDGGVVVCGGGGSPPLEEQPLMLFRPHKPPAQRLLGTARPRVLQAEQAPDGHLWARWQDGPIRRFDGWQWTTPLAESHMEHNHPFLPLGGELVLRAGLGGAALYDGQRLIDADREPRQLIHRNAELLRRELRRPGRLRPREATGVLALSVDEDGNIWFTCQEKLEVLAGDQWIDVVGTIRHEYPLFRKVGACLPVRDGACHYITDFVSPASGATLVARVVEGRLEFQRILSTTHEMRWYRPVYDEAGSLYVPIGLTLAENPDFVWGHGTLRLEGWPADEQAGMTPFAEGAPWLFDGSSDLLWLLHTKPYQAEVPARVLEGDQTLIGINLPGLVRFTDHREYAIALAHESGDVYVVAAYGLIRLSPREAQGGRYGVRAGFQLPDYPGRAVRDAWIVGDQLLVLGTTRVLHMYPLAPR